MAFLCGFVLWLAMCGGVGALARSRGRDVVAWTFLSFLISPLLAGIALLLMEDLAQTTRVLVEEAQSQSARGFAAVAQAQAAQAEERAKQLEAAKISGADFVIAIERIRQLHEKRVYSDIEFAARKQKVMADLKDRVPSEPPDDFLAALIPLLDVGALNTDELLTIKSWLHWATTSRVASPSAPRARTQPSTWSGYACERCGATAPVEMMCDQCSIPMTPTA
jgi:hypothetical protein